eukprot:5598539-Prymnesium_polylepis.1
MQNPTRGRPHNCGTHTQSGVSMVRAEHADTPLQYMHLVPQHTRIAFAHKHNPRPPGPTSCTPRLKDE